MNELLLLISILINVTFWLLYDQLGSVNNIYHKIHNNYPLIKNIIAFKNTQNDNNRTTDDLDYILQHLLNNNYTTNIMFNSFVYWCSNIHNICRDNNTHTHLNIKSNARIYSLTRNDSSIHAIGDNYKKQIQQKNKSIGCNNGWLVMMNTVLDNDTRLQAYIYGNILNIHHHNRLRICANEEYFNNNDNDNYNNVNNSNAYDRIKTQYLPLYYVAPYVSQSLVTLAAKILESFRSNTIINPTSNDIQFIEIRINVFDSTKVVNTSSNGTIFIGIKITWMNNNNDEQ
eukprot:430758_1